VICYTETDRERLHERRVTSSISVVHNGIDCSTFSPDENYEPKEERDVQILFVGRLNENKGPTRLLDAFASISDDYPDVSLTIVGEGPQLDKLDTKRRQENLTERGELLGYVPNEKLPQLYNNSSLFVLPSLNEGLPRTILEAMACETPIITSTLPQLESLVKEAGLTISRGATTELEQALRTLLDDPDRRSKMRTIGRKRIVEQYSWGETVRKTIDVYRQCLHQ
jgi:glycosyltransferase involved in cell wall biosynthesis